ncbi:hypothetical protein OH492_07120 [Vibrio chagasii]|nr:hypothetical protein [Vibrio chagasii]
MALPNNVRQIQLNLTTKNVKNRIELKQDVAKLWFKVQSCSLA